MAVYKRGPLGLDLPPVDGLLVPLIVLLILAGLYLAWPAATFNVLSAHVLQNPIYLSTNDSTLLRVTINNPSPDTMRNVMVSAAAGGADTLSVYPSSQTIASLGPQESRVLEYVVAPIDTQANPFLPGTYRIDIKTKMGNTTYTTSETVNVER